MALLLVAFSRSLSGLLLAMSLSWASQVGQGPGTQWARAGALGSLRELRQRIATEGKPTEVALGAELKDSVNEATHQCKAFLH